MATKERPARKAGRPRGSTSEQTFERIVRAARLLFAKHGYTGTQNQRVAEAAAVTTSTLYHYFGSKLDLYVTVYRESEREVAERYARAIEGGATLSAQLDAILDAALALHAEASSIPVFLATNGAEMRNHVTIARAIARCPTQTPRILREMLERAVERGELAAETDLDALVTVLVATSTGLSIYESFLGPGTHARLVAVLRETLRGRVFVRAAPAPAARTRRPR